MRQPKWSWIGVREVLGLDRIKRALKYEQFRLAVIPKKKHLWKDRSLIGCSLCKFSSPVHWGHPLRGDEEVGSRAKSLPN